MINYLFIKMGYKYTELFIGLLNVLLFGGGFAYCFLDNFGFIFEYSGLLVYLWALILPSYWLLYGGGSQTSGMDVLIIVFLFCFFAYAGIQFVTFFGVNFNYVFILILPLFVTCRILDSYV